MIRFNPTPASMLKAAILSELTGRMPQLDNTRKEYDLFSQPEELDADSYFLPELITDLTGRTSRDLAWLEQYPGRRLAVMILFALRNQAPDSANIIFAALAEALRHGPGYCLMGRGRAGSLFRRRSREVANEIHRMLGLIHFDETPGGDLLAKPKLFHNTADILLQKFQLRYPSQRLIFALPEGLLCCERGKLRNIAVQDFPASILNKKDDFAEFWETYYLSQYIPARRNIRLASHFIPKKYWDWLPEGKILEQEAGKCKKS